MNPSPTDRPRATFPGLRPGGLLVVAALAFGAVLPPGPACRAQGLLPPPESGPAPGTAPQLPDELMPYAAAGSALADSVQLGSAHWSEAQLDAFMSGIRASYDGHGYPLDARSEHLLEAMTSQHPGTQAAQDGPGGQADRLERYMSRAREQLKMQQTASGLLFRVIARGEGPHPRPEDTVLISIKAKAPDGRTELPQLEAHQVRVKVGTLFPGMAEGLQLMALGGKMFFVIPPKLSFGDGKWPDGVDRGVPLWFEVELLDIVSP